MCRIISVAFLLALLFPFFLTAVAQQKINLKDFEGQFPVKRGITGIRTVLKLKRPLLIVLPNQTIRLPRGTIIQDENYLGKIILPSNYSCVVKAGRYNMTLPKNGMLKLYKDGIEEVEVSSVSSVLNVGGQDVIFRNGLDGGLKFYKKTQTVWQGYLQNDIVWKQNNDALLLENYKGADLELEYNLFGNIAFYDNETLKAGFLKTSALFKAGNKSILAGPGFFSLYEDGTVERCVLDEDMHFLTQAYSFIIPKGNTAYFDKAGNLYADQTNYTIQIDVKDLEAKNTGFRIPAAQLTIHDSLLILSAAKVDATTTFQVCVDSKGLTYCNNIPFMPQAPYNNYHIYFYDFGRPFYGYLASDVYAQIGKHHFALKKESFIRFHPNGVISEATLAKDVIYTWNNVKYMIKAGHSLSFTDLGTISSTSFQNLSKIDKEN